MFALPLPTPLIFLMRDEPGVMNCYPGYHRYLQGVPFLYENEQNEMNCL